jgi:hypothetical protein
MADGPALGFQHRLGGAAFRPAIGRRDHASCRRAKRRLWGFGAAIIEKEQIVRFSVALIAGMLAATPAIATQLRASRLRLRRGFVRCVHQKLFVLFQEHR